MFMTDVNDVKIYNLSAGKSVPDWLTDRKKRSQLKKHVDSKRQIELIQDFDMPAVSTSIRISPDNEYILVTGTYKPRVKCFEVSNLSIKFERCFDSEVTTFEVLSDDYSKLVFLQCDRFIEFHAAHGRHYRLRIPRFGRDMSYHTPSCDLFIVGTSSDIYRLNLERGQFLAPYETSASCINVSSVNPEHHLLMVGTQEGTMEAWDPREKRKCGTLDVAFHIKDYKEFPSVTSLKFKNGLQMGIGTASGHVLLYDIRSTNPLLVKDHLNKCPVKKIDFNTEMRAVYSLDAAMLKIWDENTGKQIAYIESQTDFNDFATVPNTGMFFFAQEDVKMFTYYIPSLGPAPKWCSFLDNITEEIESEAVDNIYDDYQFITKKELEELGLEHLIGSNLLRAYMHGYFIDARLYRKARAVVDPFSYDRFRKDKIRHEVEASRASRLQMQSRLPKVNQELALKLIDEEEEPSRNKKKMPNLLKDSRFSLMFENPDFEIDKKAEEYKMLTPVLKRLENSKLKAIKKRVEVSRVEELHAEENRQHESSDDDGDLFENGPRDASSGSEDSSDDDVREFSREMKKTYKQIQRDRDHKEQEDIDAEENEEEEDGYDVKDDNIRSKTRMLEINDTNEFRVGLTAQAKSTKLTLQHRLAKIERESYYITNNNGLGNKEINFVTKGKTHDMKKREYEMKKHREERRKIIRPTSTLRLKRLRMQ